MGAGQGPGGRLPAPGEAPSSGWLPRSRALRVDCLSIATPALKAARPPLREGAETERGEGEGKDAAGPPAESTLSEQLVGRHGGGDLGDTTQPTIPRPQLASYPGKQGLGPVPTSLSAPSDSLKRAMVRDPTPSLSFRPAFQFKVCLTFPHYPASQLGKGAEVKGDPSRSRRPTPTGPQTQEQLLRILWWIPGSQTR